MPTREEEFTRVRELLDYPLYGRPNPHVIISELIRQEQFQMNRLSGNNRPWSQNSTTVTTVANTAEYTITPADFGKPLFVYRALENNHLLPVPFTDYQSEIHNQTREFWIAPMDAGMNPPLSGEKCAFFRTSGGTRKMRLYPVPETAGVIYQIVYASGWADWSAFAMSDVPVLPEWSDYRCLQTAAFLLPRAEWEGLSRAENSEKRKELAMSLQVQFARQESEFDSWVRNPQSEPPTDAGYWYE